MATIVQKISESLNEQLVRKHADEYHFKKLVEDYCNLVKIKQELQQDIKEKGVTITEYNVKGFEVHKTNPSVAEITKVTASMIKILDVLGIDADNNIKGDEETDDTGL